MRLVPYQEAPKNRGPGALEGKIHIAGDFDQTPQEIIGSFYETEDKLKTRRE